MLTIFDNDKGNECGDYGDVTYHYNDGKKNLGNDWEHDGSCFHVDINAKPPPTGSPRPAPRKSRMQT